MSLTHEEYVKRLTELSCKKGELLNEMLILTKEQSNSINEDEIEILERIISNKQVIIDSVDKIDADFDVYFKRLKQELNVKSLDELETNINGVKDLQESIKKIMELIKEISEIEKQNNDKAKRVLDLLGEEIKTINQGKKANLAYNPGPIKSPSYFIDKKK